MLSTHWTDAVSKIPFETVYYYLRLFDAYLLEQWGTPTTNEASQIATQPGSVEAHNEKELNRARDSWLAEDFVALCVCIELIEGDDDASDRCKFRCPAIYLRSFS